MLKLLLQTLLDSGCVLVASSNRPISKLYEGGVNYEYFKPTLGVLKRHMKEVKVGEDEGVDHRRGKEGQGKMYFRTGNGGVREFLKKRGFKPAEKEINAGFGRVVKIGRQDKGMAVFDVEEVREEEGEGSENTIKGGRE